MTCDDTVTNTPLRIRTESPNSLTSFQAECHEAKRNKPFMKTKLSWMMLAAGFTAISANAEESHIDATMPSYASVSGVSGNLNSIGSDSLNNLMTLWAEGFKKAYPNVNIQIEGKGSSTAPPALIEGTAQIGPMSRPMKAEEIDAFEKKYGYKPTEVKVAIDALAVFAHKDNPIKGLSIKQVDSIFSATRKKGGSEISTWDQAGLTAWKGRSISLFGRNSASGTYGFFQENALGKGDYKSSVKEQPGSSAVVQGIGADPYAIGSGVRAVPLTSEDGGEFYEANYDNALSGDYPLARFLILYVNKKPGEPMDKLTLEFLKYVLSKEGQQVVEKDGYFPIPKDFAGEIVRSLSK
jgi:phosphate transport system substrate-binding protein